MRSAAFERLAAVCAVAVAVSGIAFAAAFLVVLRDNPEGADALTDALLLVAGLLSTAVYVALYARLRETDQLFALWALALGLGGAFGSVAHGGFDLANKIEDPAADVGFPSPTDPRGLFTFGITALAALVVAWLIYRGGEFPRPLAYLATASAVLLLIVYFGRLIIFDPESPGVLAAAVLVGFVVNPAFYAWLGLELWRGANHAERAPAAGAKAPR